MRRLPLNNKILCAVANYLIHVYGLPEIVVPGVSDWYLDVGRNYYVRINWNFGYLESNLSDDKISELIELATTSKVPRYLSCYELN